MIEVEIRAKINNLKETEDKLKQLGAKLIEEKKQTDRVFGHKKFLDENNMIIEGGVSARIRKVNEECTLEFKEIQRHSGGTEIKSKLHNEKEGEKLLEKLGFEEAFAVEKNRKEYKLKELTICLDRVKELGEFIEIEKEITEEEEKETSRNECTALLKQIAPKAIIETKKYGDLMQEKINKEKTRPKNNQCVSVN